MNAQLKGVALVVVAASALTIAVTQVSGSSEGKVAAQPETGDEADSFEATDVAAESSDQDRSAVALHEHEQETAEESPEESPEEMNADTRYHLKYEGLSPEELKSVYSHLRTEFRAVTRPIYKERWESGQYEVAATFTPGVEFRDDLYHLEDDPYSVRFQPHGEIQRIRLTQDEFPVLWEAWQELKWLNKHTILVEAQRARSLHGHKLQGQG